MAICCNLNVRHYQRKLAENRHSELEETSERSPDYSNVTTTHRTDPVVVVMHSFFRCNAGYAGLLPYKGCEVLADLDLDLDPWLGQSHRCNFGTNLFLTPGPVGTHCQPWVGRPTIRRVLVRIHD